VRPSARRQAASKGTRGAKAAKAPKSTKARRPAPAAPTAPVAPATPASRWSTDPELAIPFGDDDEAELAGF
jgi:hypothetical protein